MDLHGFIDSSVPERKFDVDVNSRDIYCIITFNQSTINLARRRLQNVSVATSNATLAFESIQTVKYLKITRT